VVSGPHPLDHDSLRETVRIPQQLGSVEGLRIAWSMDFDYVPIDPEVRAKTRAMLEVFEGLGCALEEVSLGWTEACDEAALAWFGSMHFGRQTLWQAAEHRELMTEDAIAMAEFCSGITLDQMARSWEKQHEMYQVFGPIMERCDLFVCPTTSIPAVRVDHDPWDEDFRVNGIRVNPEYGWILTHPFNMLHYCPVLSVPSGRATNGVPTGIQIVGRTFDDVTVFRAGAALEAAVGGWLTDPASRPTF
jgi:Asp-tRNA(Asn)/Glu-tRNA(Gln) amidotransferase A subunit family amidase